MLFVVGFNGYGQLSNQRVLVFSFADSIQLDSMMIIPRSFILKCNDKVLDHKDYELNCTKSKLYLREDCEGEYKAEFRVYPFNFSQPYQLRDTSLLYSKEKGIRENLSLIHI